MIGRRPIPGGRRVAVLRLKSVDGWGGGNSGPSWTEVALGEERAEGRAGA